MVSLLAMGNAYMVRSKVGARDLATSVQESRDNPPMGISFAHTPGFESGAGLTRIIHLA